MCVGMFVTWSLCKFLSMAGGNVGQEWPGPQGLLRGDVGPVNLGPCDTDQ